MRTFKCLDPDNNIVFLRVNESEGGYSVWKNLDDLLEGDHRESIGGIGFSVIDGDIIKQLESDNWGYKIIQELTI